MAPLADRAVRLRPRIDFNERRSTLSKTEGLPSRPSVSHHRAWSRSISAAGRRDTGSPEDRSSVREPSMRAPSVRHDAELTPTSTASRRSAPDRSAPDRSAPARSAPRKLACFRLARTSLQSFITASVKSAATATTPVSRERSRLAPARQAPLAWVSCRARASITRKPIRASAAAMVPSRRSASNRSAPVRSAPRRQAPRKSARRIDASARIASCMSAPKKVALSSRAPDRSQPVRSAAEKSASARLRPFRSSPLRSIQANTARAPPGRACHRRSWRAQIASTSLWVSRRRATGSAAWAMAEPCHTHA